MMNVTRTLATLCLGVSLAACSGSDPSADLECEGDACDEFDYWRTPAECADRATTVLEYTDCMMAVNDRMASEIGTDAVLDALREARDSTNLMGAQQQLLWDSIRPADYDGHMENQFYSVLTTPTLVDPRTDYRIGEAPAECLESYLEVLDRATSKAEQASMIWALTVCTQRVADELYRESVGAGIEAAAPGGLGASISNMVNLGAIALVDSVYVLCEAVIPRDKESFDVAFATCNVSGTNAWYQAVLAFERAYGSSCEPTANRCLDVIDNDCDGEVDEDDECTPYCGDGICEDYELEGACPEDCG